MRWLKSLFLFLVLVASVLIGIALLLHNDQQISVNLIWLQTPEAAVAVWLMVFFVAGLLIGVSVSVVAYLWIRGRTCGLRRKVKKLESKVSDSTPVLPSQS